MSEKMFETMINKPKSTHKWLFFPISLLFHGLLIAGVIVMPLLNADYRMPEIKMVDVFLTAPPPPQTPAPPKGKRSNSKKGSQSSSRQVKPRPKTLREFVPPIEIPEEIPEESFEDILGGMNLGDNGEVDGGVIGIDDGIDGPSILGTGDGNASSAGTAQLTQVIPPKVIKRVPPIYPVAASRARIDGVVAIEAVTDIYGRVVKVNVVSGHPLLRGAAIQAVKQWIFEPYMFNGIPRPVSFTVNVIFKLEKRLI